MSELLRVWFVRHLQVLFETLGRLWQTPIASLMTTLVIAIAIALPLVLFQIVLSVDRLSAGWQGAPQISVFLKADTSDGAVDPVEAGQTLLQNPKVEDVQYISPEEGLSTFYWLSFLLLVTTTLRVVNLRISLQSFLLWILLFTINSGYID